MPEMGPVRTHMLSRESRRHSATSLGAITRFCQPVSPCASPYLLNIDGILPTFPSSALGSPVWRRATLTSFDARSEEHTSELQSRENLVCRLLLEKKKKKTGKTNINKKKTNKNQKKKKKKKP